MLPFLWPAAIPTSLFAVFLALRRLAPGAEGKRRTAGLLAIGLCAACCGLALLTALFLFLVTCDDTCNEILDPRYRGGSWWTWESSWQWWAQLALAGTAFLALVIATRRQAMKRGSSSIRWMAVGVLVFAAWNAMLAPKFAGLP